MTKLQVSIVGVYQSIRGDTRCGSSGVTRGVTRGVVLYETYHKMSRHTVLYADRCCTLIEENGPACVSLHLCVSLLLLKYSSTRRSRSNSFSQQHTNTCLAFYCPSLYLSFSLPLSSSLSHFLSSLPPALIGRRTFAPAHDA